MRLDWLDKLCHDLDQGNAISILCNPFALG